MPGQRVGGDETRFLIDDPGNYTYEQIGARRVQAVTTGHNKISVCCLMTAAGDGDKLDFICLIDREPTNPIIGLVVPPGCIVEYCKKATFNSTNLKALWIDRVLKPYMTKKSYSKILLALDSANPHIEKNFQKALKDASIISKQIIRGMTGVLQMADVFWFAFIKK